MTRYGGYVPAFVDLGRHGGSRGVLFAAAVALLFTVSALALRIWGSSYLSAETVWRPEARTDALLVAGPFRYVRHPLYAGNVLLAIGIGAVAPLEGWIFIVVANAIFIGALIRFEERGLATSHGDAFTRYRGSVPALLPRVVPVATQGNVCPSLAQGVKAECFTTFVLLGVVALFAVPSYGWAVFIICYAVGTVVQYRIERASHAE